MHLGSLVAAVGSYLAAKAAGGAWRMRIEDIDTPRVVPGAADDILRTLEAFGLYWDGPVLWQSHRTADYRAATEHLLTTGAAYLCSCSRRDVAEASGYTGIYPGICRNGPRDPTRPMAVRVRTDDTPIDFIDERLGPQRQCLQRDVGDFVIHRADGLYAYQLAVVLDDAEQGVNQVVRGADLLDSTARQIHLHRLLALPIPTYRHLPLVLDTRGAKLSKSTQAMPVDKHNPAPALAAALRFLGVAVAGMEGASCADLLAAGMHTAVVAQTRHR